MNSASILPSWSKLALRRVCEDAMILYLKISKGYLNNGKDNIFTKIIKMNNGVNTISKLR